MFPCRRMCVFMMGGAMLCGVAFWTGCQNPDRPGQRGGIEVDDDNEKAGDNLWQSGNVDHISQADLPTHALIIRHSCDGTWSIGEKRFSVVDDVAKWLTNRSESEFGGGIIIENDSKLWPPEEDVSLLCSTAAAKNVNLFCRLLIDGGTCRLNEDGTTEISASAGFALWCVRSTANDSSGRELGGN